MRRTGDSVPDNDLTLIEELAALVLVVQLELEHVERAAPLVRINVVHEDVWPPVFERSSHLSEAIP